MSCWRISTHFVTKYEAQSTTMPAGKAPLNMTKTLFFCSIIIFPSASCPLWSCLEKNVTNSLLLGNLLRYVWIFPFSSQCSSIVTVSLPIFVHWTLKLYEFYVMAPLYLVIVIVESCCGRWRRIERVRRKKMMKVSQEWDRKKRENFRVLRQKAFLTQFWNVPRILAVL